MDKIAVLIPWDMCHPRLSSNSTPRLSPGIYKNYKPMHFFGALCALLILLALVLMIPIIDVYLRTDNTPANRLISRIRARYPPVHNRLPHTLLIKAAMDFGRNVLGSANYSQPTVPPFPTKASCQGS